MKWDACNHAPQAAPYSYGMLQSKITRFFSPSCGCLAHIVTAHGLKLKCHKSSIHSHYHVINVSEPSFKQIPHGSSPKSVFCG